MRSSVDLPQPDGPTKTTNSPCLISRSMPWSDIHGAIGLADILQLEACHVILPFPPRFSSPTQREAGEKAAPGRQICDPVAQMRCEAVPVERLPSLPRQV